MSKSDLRAVILLRGINVGGKNMLPMTPLLALCKEVGFLDVKAYLQSGNLVASSKEKVSATRATELGLAIARDFGFHPHIQIVQADDFIRAAEANPYKDIVSADEGKAVHLYFLEREPADCKAKLDALKTADEAWTLKGRVFYLHVPQDFHKSKLAARAEKILGVNATARNWRTVSKIAEMLK